VKKTLLAITTYNQLKYTEICRESIPEIEDLDVIFVDDKSTDNTVEHLKSKGSKVIEKDKGAGLTDSWNLAYRIFKEQDYNALIISNNDVVFNISLENMLNGFDFHEFVVPMTGREKAGCSKERQEVKTYHKNFRDENTSVAKNNIQIIYNNIRYIPTTWFHGFCFGFTREIIKLELDANHLFNPKNINVHQEADLYKRLEKNKISPHVCTGTYVYHYGSQSLPYRGQVEGQDSRQLLEWNRERIK
jgi:GT2 family glycosyltransferase